MVKNIVLDPQFGTRTRRYAILPVEVLVLQPTLARRGVTNTGQDDFVLDNAFALIEGLQGSWREANMAESNCSTFDM
jgi:hypothetical protein